MHQVQRERQTSVQGRLCISVPAAVDHWLRLPFSRGQANSRCSRHSTARSWLKIAGIWRISVHLVRVLLRFTASTREGAPCRSTRLSRLIASRPYAPGYARPDMDYNSQKFVETKGHPGFLLMQKAVARDGRCLPRQRRDTCDRYNDKIFPEAKSCRARSEWRSPLLILFITTCH